MLSDYTDVVRIHKEFWKKEGYEDVESHINNGWCIPLAIHLKKLGDKKNHLTEIVRSYAHWFLRIYLNEEINYIDAWVEEGTKDLLVITDSLDEDLEVWGIEDLLALKGVGDKYKFIKDLVKDLD